MTRASRRQHTRKLKFYHRLRNCIIAAIIIAAVIFGWFGLVHRQGPLPDQVAGLKADTTYAAMKLHWDQAKKADGYYVYASDGEELEKIATIEGGENCHYNLKKYTHDKEYQFQVAAYGENPVSHNRREGKPSETLTAEYVSSDYAQKIPILAYHKVIPAGWEFNSSLNITADVLEEHFAYLHDNGFKTLTLDEFYEWHAGRLEVPVKSCVITFDDGFYGAYYLSYPIIKKFDQAATMFLIGKNIEDETHPYTPEEDGEQNHYVGKDVIDQVREDYPKFEFESHTFAMHNRVGGEEPALVYSYDQIMDDIAQNEKFGFRYLAYPCGDYSETIQKALKDSGYKMAFAYDPFHYAKRSDDTYAVSRIKIPGKIEMDKFIRIVNGEESKYDTE